MAVMVLTKGAPANTIGITAAAAAAAKIGDALPSESTSANAPTAPAMPATRLHVTPVLVRLQSEPRILMTTAATTPMTAYAMQTNRNALRLACGASVPIGISPRALCRMTP